MKRIDTIASDVPGDRIALVDRQRTLNYTDLEQEVARVAAGLAARAKPGDRIAIWLPKNLEMVVSFLAISRMGGVVVPINPVLRGRQVVHILEDSGASLLITHQARQRTLEWDGETIVLEDDWAGLGGRAVEPLGDGADDLAALLYTSGSTGRPKGVMVTHDNLQIGVKSVVSYLGLEAEDVVLSVLPLSFDFGLSQVTTGLSVGAKVILLDYLAPRDVVKTVERHGVTTLAAVPPLWMQLTGLEWPEAARASLRILSNSGGRLPVPTVQALRQLFPKADLHLMYGLTEAFRSTTLPPHLTDSRPTSIGRAIPDAEILVVREDGSVTEDGEVGELVHCGPLVTKGYWQDPERTSLRFRPAPEISTYGGMAVWSGDKVVRDADGFLTFVGREDETIKTMGTRVSPTEIEELVYLSGAVSDVVVLGLPDEKAGHLIRLIASPAKGLETVDAETQLRAYLRREGPAYMQPDRIIWLSELPRSANGKLDRAMLRAEYASEERP